MFPVIFIKLLYLVERRRGGVASPGPKAPPLCPTASTLSRTLFPIRVVLAGNLPDSTALSRLPARTLRRNVPLAPGERGPAPTSGRLLLGALVQGKEAGTVDGTSEGIRAGSPPPSVMSLP